MDQDMDNLELGRQEIWRREKIVVFLMILFLPYGLFIIMPLSHFIGTFIELPLFAIYGLFVFIVGSWLSKSPCPNCGRPIWAPIAKLALRYKKCIHCGMKLRPLTKKDHKISFRPIHYRPGVINDDRTEQWHRR